MELSLKAAFSNMFEVFIAGGDSFAYTEKTELPTVRSSEGVEYNPWNEFL
ncbi:hypothetical protein [Peribacillus frigoritolerans]|nr:hypothetical protein [Peribacillus frigoritolerans]